MNEKALASVTYWNQFIRYSEEQNLELNYAHIEAKLAAYKGQDFAPFIELKDLVDEVYKMSKCPWLGLHFAQKLQLSSHGSLGFAISHGVDLGECLELLSRYYQTRLQAIEISNNATDDNYFLEIKETCDWQPIRVLLYEVLLSSLINVIEFVIGQEVKQCSVLFPYQAPQWENKYLELLPCQVHFGSKSAGISIPKALLSINSVTANPRSVGFAREQCDQELSRLKQLASISDKVITLIEHAHDYSISIDEMARNLNMSKSTLARKLKLEGTSFSELVTQLRKSQAANLLRHTDSSIEAIALTLGYDDASNFNRSFKRWFTCSPSQYRQTHRR